MHVIIAEPRGQLEKMIADAVSEEMPNARLSFARNLATAYTAAEHENPDVFIVSDVLAVLPEFKVLSEIFRALSIGCIVFHEGQVDRIGNPEQVRISQAVCVARHDLKRVLRTWAHPGKKSGRMDQSSPGAHECTFDDGLVLLGASTGGVDALIQVLGTFPENCPPTLIVQHTNSKFGEGLADILDKHVAPQVDQASSLSHPSPGTILVAPGGRCHLKVKKVHPRRAVLEPADGSHAHCPSVDELFLSAVPHAKTVSAALLTGMGKDGARGLLALRQAGARTFAQDQESCVVYGMPKAAMDLGAVERQLPLNKIGPALLDSRRRSQT